MISIIVPVYNVEKYLDQCIDSIIKQTYTDWECILINDGSSDNSDIICDYWKERDSRIIVVHQPNSGVSTARNTGIDLAKGDYITFIDSDDWIDSNYLSQLISNSNTYDLVISGLIEEFADHKTFIHTPNNVIISIREKVGNFDEIVEKGLIYSPCIKLFRSSIIQKHNLRFPTNKSFGEDLEFCFSYLEFINSVICIPYCGYHYRKSQPCSLSSVFRADQFFNDFEQWTIQYDFYRTKGFLTHRVEKWLYKRLWGQTIDGLFLFKINNHNTRYQYIKAVLSLPNTKKMYQYKNTFNCSNWIKLAIKYRCNLLFYVLFKTQKILCK